jgi:hypothetical protein
MQQLGLTIAWNPTGTLILGQLPLSTPLLAQDQPIGTGSIPGRYKISVVSF